MFTGIIQIIGTVVEIIKQGTVLHYAVSFPHNHLQLGASVSIDGVCQTAVKIEEDRVWFDAIDETLQKTTFDSLFIGRKVNIERSAKIGDEIGGHLLSGHIYGTVTLLKIEKNIYTFGFAKDLGKYFFQKGYVAIDGMSLTLVDVTKETFSVHLIPETLKRTTIGQKKVGEHLNVELDSITQAAVETVLRMHT